MAKKCDRRVAAASDRRRTEQVEGSALSIQDVDSSVYSHARRDRRLITLLILFFVVGSLISFVVYRRTDDKHTDAAHDLPYVYRRGLVKTDMDYAEVLDENMNFSDNTTHRHFNNPVLAYITPWNSKGYVMAKQFSNKFTHISPVWYELKSQGTNLVLEGRHNADKTWIAELRMRGDALVLPRVVLEAKPKDMLKKRRERQKAIDLIVTECKEMEYDGIVLESWSRWAVYGVLRDPSMRNKALLFIKELGEAMHSVSSDRKVEQGLQLVYVIGPPHLETLEAHDFGPEDLKSLVGAVDSFSLMLYDFSGSQNPGPNAPIKWIHAVLEVLLGTENSRDQSLAQKLFVGLNFYGRDFSLAGGSGGGPITGREYLALMEEHRPTLQWEKNIAEHLFLYYDDQDHKHAVFYPSLMSIAMRLEVAQSWGAGVSIWEIGQGLDYFFDIL